MERPRQAVLRCEGAHCAAGEGLGPIGRSAPGPSDLVARRILWPRPSVVSVSRLRIYYFSPELLTDVPGELGVPVRTNGRGLD
jgi:hypothetical protein